MINPERYRANTKVYSVRKILQHLAVGKKVRVRRDEFKDLISFRNCVIHAAAYACTKYSVTYNKTTDVVTVTRIK